MKSKSKIARIIIAVICIISTAVVVAVAEPEMQKRRNLSVFSSYYQMKVSKFIEENENVEKGGVVFLGDSITDLCNLDKFYPDLHAVNRGIGGDYTIGVLGRMDNSVYDLEPKLVVMLIGINDLSLGFKPKDIINNIHKILTEIHKNSPDTKIIVQSVYPVNSDWNEAIRDHHTPLLNEINKTLAAESEEYGYTFANVYEVLADEDGFLMHDYANDGLHPNDKGYEIISAYLTPIINKTLKGKVTIVNDKVLSPAKREPPFVVVEGTIR